MDMYVNGSRLELGKRIGKGGEGEVFLANNQNQTAVKIYTPKLARSREEKVVAMVEGGLWKESNMIAFPKGVVRSKKGEFLGFTMNVVEGHRPVHELYGVKSRKNHYPKADFRFLIRAATNAARAVGQVHQSPCVIGDLNHSGVLVSEKATVALIDADSFQFEQKGKRYPCLVGVADFTPPELHGSSLNGVLRLKEHDYFGLGVAIFQLLFMGKHPYAGRYSGADFDLEQMIARNLFAYSIKRTTGVTPPKATLLLQDLPSEITDLFERCFGLYPNERPNAGEWANALTKLESNLTRCSIHNTHYFPSAAKSCPWCKIENQTGAILFMGYFDVSATVGPQGSIDIDRLWREIEQIVLPNIASIHPPIGQISKPAPTQAAQEAKKSPIKWKKYLGVATIIGLWIATPQLTIIWIIALFWAWSSLDSTKSINTKEWQDKYSKVDEAYENAVNAWEARAGIQKLFDLKKTLEEAAKDYRALPSAKSAALQKIQTERKNRQLGDFLDRYQIRNASIPGIGPAKTVTLASYGIETAADISHHAVISVPGFGDATAAKLMAWRQVYERKFVYNPTSTPEDAQARAKVEAEFASKARTLATKLTGGKKELAQLAKTTHNRLTTPVPELATLYADKLQAEVDLEFLGISKPYKYKAATTTTYNPNVTRSTMPPPVSGTTPSCPQCGSSMVRRVARRGSNRGNSFWGCSRFPRCKGTRS
ncbi:MAG: hypothetical protein DYH13_09280 [Alphaproteobacteria bacterium PRO2]|nr:hypothetical protein [Alphaproteobacteria bacterium PRO2]